MRWEQPHVNVLQKKKKRKKGKIKNIISFGCSEVSSSFLSFPTFGG